MKWENIVIILTCMFILNVNKTDILIFSVRKLRKQNMFNFGEHMLDTVDEYNYLGLVFFDVGPTL